MSGRFGQLNPYDLHKRLINEYVLKRAGDTSLLLGRDASRDKTDADVLREHHRFLWDDREEAGAGGTLSWEQQLARKYYDKLFKEYCVCDLSRFKENMVALRWRTEREVIDGRGQFSCGHKICTSRDNLRSWEVNFAYREQSERKNALVKVRLCPDCSAMLNYRSKKREVKKLKREARKSRKPKRTKDRSTTDDGSAEPHGSERAERTDTDGGCTTEDDESAVRKGANAPGAAAAGTDGECWSKATTVEEKSREEEFDEYLEDLLL